MQSLMHRGNAIGTLFIVLAAILGCLTSMTDLIHKSDPKVKLDLAEVKKFVPYSGGREQAVITFNLEADLRSVFSWNSKQIFVFVRAEYLSDKGKLNQVVLWDSIIQQKEKARIKLKKHKSKYAFIDIGRNLRDKDVNLTLVWDIMPRIGALRMDSRSFRVGKMPAAYVS